MAGSIIFTDSWEPGHWCGAALQLCAEHLVEGEEEDTRYPEQWIYLLWLPTAHAVPFRRPDGWGLTVGHPQHEMRECLPTAFDPMQPEPLRKAAVQCRINRRAEARQPARPLHDELGRWVSGLPCRSASG